MQRIDVFHKTPRENINILTLEGVAEYRDGLSYYISNKALNDQTVSEYFTK